MRSARIGLGLALCCGLLFAGGCAKEQVVKPEESMAAKTPAPEPQPAKPIPPPETKTTPSPKDEAAEAAARAAEAAREVKTDEIKPVVTEPITSLKSIYFSFDSSDLSEASRATLKSNYGVLAKNSGFKVQIEGHCDERGSDEYNLALGDRRAKAAMTYLVTLGVRPERLSTISYGKEKPVDPGHTEEAWAKNRRDEFVLIK